MSKNYVSLYKYLVGYKFVEYKQSVGFPESAFGKVKSILDKENMSYKVYDKDMLLESKNGIDKKYKVVLKEALKNYELEQRLTRIRNKINDFSTDELEKIIEGIESRMRESCTYGFVRRICSDIYFYSILYNYW